MRVVLILIALLAGIVAGVASAGISNAGVPVAAEPRSESTSVQAVRAVITRCLPSVGQRGEAVTAGLTRLPPQDERAILGDRAGRVYLRPQSLLLIDFEDAPACRVVALSVDPAVLADLVIQVFSGEADTFKTERFRMDEDGGFAAVYSGLGLVIRITTTREENGNHFAAFTVARMDAKPR